jgi:hypothetical protein
VLYVLKPNTNNYNSVDILSTSDFSFLGSLQPPTQEQNILPTLIYNSTENLVYVGNYYGTTNVYEFLSTSTTLTASCQTCETVIESKFVEVKNSGTTEFFDCEKCVGLQDDGIEVIIETIPITGNTSSSCVQNNSYNTCSEVFIKSINDDVMFSGYISRQYNSIPIGIKESKE